MSLEEMKDVNVMAVDPGTLKDIKDVHIDPKLPREERCRQFLEQIGNPYCFRNGKTVIKLKFAENGETLEDRLLHYISTK